MSDFEDIGFMFGLTTATEEAGCFERRLTDQVDGLVEMLARMYCATSKVYVPYKVTARQSIALYKHLEQHCRDMSKKLGNYDNWVVEPGSAADIEMTKTAPDADIPVHDEEEALPF